MSRFGRDYLKVGYYLDVIFPLKNIRFIAINDNVDSDKGLDDFLPFKNILNEWYARDTSKKIKAVLRAKAERGEHLCTNPPYGYLKDPDNPKHWIVDKEAAEVIKRIFRLYISGKGALQIANILTKEKVLNPTSHKAKLGINTIHKLENDTLWYYGTVANILDNMEYLGYTINNKTYRKSYKDKKMYFNDEKDWLVFENTHDAIIDKDTFDLVKKMRNNKRVSNKYDMPDLFLGLLYCADCGARLYQRRFKNIKDNYYYCSTYKKRKPCSIHNTKTDRLLIKIYSEIRIMLKKCNNSKFLEKLLKNFESDKNKKTAELSLALESKENRIAELQIIFKNLYDEKMSKKLSEIQFNQLYDIYNKEFQQLNNETVEITKEIEAIKNKKIDIYKFTKNIKKYAYISDISELTAGILNDLIDKIICYEPQGIGKKRQQRIDIYWIGIGFVNSSIIKYNPLLNNIHKK